MDTFIELLKTEGPLWALFAVLIYLMMRYTPVVVRKHLATLDSITQTQTESASTMRTIGDKVAIAGRFDAATHRASVSLAEALVATAEQDPERTREHTNQMLRELSDATPGR